MPREISGVPLENAGGQSFGPISFTDALTNSVNTVFASASLPVSANTQGTYLNQVYIGMFRPDGNALPRWVGNLKQYQFVYDVQQDSLQLADAALVPAVSTTPVGASM